MRCAALSTRGMCPRLAHSAGTSSGPEASKGEKPGGAKAPWPGLTGSGGLLLWGSFHLGPSHLTLIAAMALTHFTDKETEPQGHLVICPGDTAGALGFLLGWILRNETLVFRPFGTRLLLSQL